MSRIVLKVGGKEFTSNEILRTVGVLDYLYSAIWRRWSEEQRARWFLWRMDEIRGGIERRWDDTQWANNLTVEELKGTIFFLENYLGQDSYMEPMSVVEDLVLLSEERRKFSLW